MDPSDPLIDAGTPPSDPELNHPNYISSFLSRLSLTDWITAIGTVVIAAATVWNVFYVRGQLNAMREAAPDTAKLVQANQDLAAATKTQASNSSALIGIAQRSAAAAGLSAKAASAQVVATNLQTAAQRDQMITEQRAMIGGTGVVLGSEILPGTATQFALNFANLGIQPAERLEHTIKWSVLDPNFKNDASAFATRAHAIINSSCNSTQPNNKGVTTYNRAEGYSVKGTLPISMNEQMDVKSGNAILVVAGCFAYITFEQTHKDGFCFYYLIGESKPMIFNICPGNGFRE